MRETATSESWRARAFVPMLVWTATVLWIGSRPGIELPATDLAVDKLGHFGMYGILGLTLAWGWLQNGRRPGAALLVLVGILVGVLDELVQISVPGRSAEIADVVADAAGVVTGFMAGARLFGRRTRRQGEG